jgi:1,3-beta-glucan synthase
MGFDSINGFNFKIAGGGGEWAISRESYRMGTRLDFFRLMAFYHAAVGFYINSWFTYLAVYLNVYALLLFAWAQATEIQADSVQRVYNVQQVCAASRR